MKQLFETDELIGKTIKGVFDEGNQRMIMTFDDNSFAVIYANSNWEDNPDVIIEADDFDTTPKRSNYAELYRYGMISQFVFDELDIFFKQMAIDEAKQIAENKRKEEVHKLQQLAQKYPDIATLKPICNHEFIVQNEDGSRLTGNDFGKPKIAVCHKCGFKP